MVYKELFEKTYSGKKVLLTGHTGFKGSWMLAWLHKLGAIVKGYALAAEGDDALYNLIEGDKLCSSEISDIRDNQKLSLVISAFQPDFIFHFAAQPLVRLSYETPLYTFEVNVNGTAHVLEAVKMLGNKCVVVLVTTDKVYENNETGQAYNELDKLGGYDPYSASKAAAEIVISSYRNSFFNSKAIHQHGKAVASARAGNVIGGGDFASDRIVPDIIRALQKNEPVVIRNPQSVRPWQHVLEPLCGYLLLGVKLNEEPELFSDAWNFGPCPDDVLTVEELVKEAIQVYGGGTYTIQQQSGQLHEANLLSLDINKARKYLNWKPLYDSKEAVRHTINWYKTATRATALQLLSNQIDEYCSHRID